ncbi:hypothetical protein BDM02DRAFT_3192470 [Thelephora ganbajun]|uniref:Uncharacterized protein n=1 Tax=Thelephora ganbajun TaxID=370292 RepID=A0ACB6Z0A9_THEGA|nr:hypothetical protein BDM02DRAFT_3192470 [Thelephora ganbajun]
MDIILPTTPQAQCHPVELEDMLELCILPMCLTPSQGPSMSARNVATTDDEPLPVYPGPAQLGPVHPSPGNNTLVGDVPAYPKLTEDSTDPPPTPPAITGLTAKASPTTTSEAVSFTIRSTSPMTKMQSIKLAIEQTSTCWSSRTFLDIHIGQPIQDVLVGLDVATKGLTIKI